VPLIGLWTQNTERVVRSGPCKGMVACDSTLTETDKDGNKWTIRLIVIPDGTRKRRLTAEARFLLNGKVVEEAKDSGPTTIDRARQEAFALLRRIQSGEIQI